MVFSCFNFILRLKTQVEETQASNLFCLILNLEINIFRVVGVGRFTPLLHHFPLDIWKPGGSFIMKKPQGILFGKLEFNSYERLMWTLGASFYPNKIPLKTITSYCSREDSVGTCRPDSRNREISRNQA